MGFVVETRKRDRTMGPCVSRFLTRNLVKIRREWENKLNNLKVDAIDKTREVECKHRKHRRALAQVYIRFSKLPFFVRICTKKMICACLVQFEVSVENLSRPKHLLILALRCTRHTIVCVTLVSYNEFHGG